MIFLLEFTLRNKENLEYIQIICYKFYLYRPTLIKASAANVISKMTIEW